MDTNRRDFIKGAATAVAALPTFNILSEEYSHTLGPDADPINVGIIGCGCEGEVLLCAAVKIPGVRIRAVCDIWDYNRKKARGFARGYGHADCAAYEDYREMLEKEDKNLDIVLVATPCWMHAEHTNACLRAGKHVYCEKPMSNDLKRARSMVQAQRETGKLLQIGHQRRSNPRYIHAINRVLRGANMLGSVPHAYAQWHRSVAPFVSVPRRMVLPTETLERYGYENVEQFLNWRWFAKYGGGPILDLGSHQIDLFLWAWDSVPVSVTAVGGNEFYGRQENDNVTVSYEFKHKDGKTSRGLYQVLTTTSKGSFYEQFMGENGTLTIAEIPNHGNFVQRDTGYYSDREPRWDTFVAQGLIRDAFGKLKDTYASVAINCASTPFIADVFPGFLYRANDFHNYNRLMFQCDENTYKLPVDLNKPAHMPHLENFILAVRQGRPDLLTCPAEVAYRTNVAVLAANEAIARRQTITFKPGDFIV